MNAVTNKLALTSLGVPEKSVVVEEIDELQRVKLKIAAVEYCLDISGNVYVPPVDTNTDFGRQIQRFMQGTPAFLLKQLEHLQGKETALLQSEVLIQNVSRCRTHDRDFSAVWTSIVNDQIVEKLTDRRVWSLPDDLNWIGGIKELYNRPCYDKITEELDSLKCVLVKGTPGIGKTLYLQVLLVHLVRRARAKGLALPSIHYVRKVMEKVVTLSFLANGSVIDITDDKGVPRPDYLLSDSVDINEPSGKILNLEVASDKVANYNNFEKRIDEAKKSGKGKILTMTLFSFDELLVIEPGMEVALAEFRYQIFGGSARNFAAISGPDEGGALDYVERIMTVMFDDIKNAHYDWWRAVVCQISPKLSQKGADNPTAVVNSMMLHMLDDGTHKVLASKFMQLLAAEIYESRTGDIIKELETIFGRSGMGNAFESTGHRKLVQSTQPFMLKPLISSSFVKNIPSIEEALFNRPVVRFKSIEDIVGLGDGTYGLPLDISFPAVDAILQPDTLLQFTVSPIRHNGNVTRLPEIRDKLNEKDWTKHRIIFVVPEKNLKAFQYHTNLGDICQFVCLAEPSVMSTEIPNTKKKSTVAKNGK